MNPVPWLRSGVGNTPDEGGCVMQIVSWIHNHGWTDDPVCVHQIIRGWAISANDKLPDDERQELLKLVPRLMGTNFPEREAQEALEKISIRAHDASRALRQKLHDEGVAAAQSISGQIGIVIRWKEAQGRLALACVKEMLDEFDRITGRGVQSEVDYTEVCAVMGAPV